MGGRLPIKAVYPGLDVFFVSILKVETVTDVFMMEELAKAAVNPSEDIRDLILHTALVLSPQSSRRDLQDSIDSLQKAHFLPCKTPDGMRKYLGLSDNFFVLDDVRYREAFIDRITTLDFTYQEHTKLHRLFSLLGLNERFLTRHVKQKTAEGDAVLDEHFTEWFHNCAYAFSWCVLQPQALILLSADHT